MQYTDSFLSCRRRCCYTITDYIFPLKNNYNRMQRWTEVYLPLRIYLLWMFNPHKDNRAITLNVRDACFLWKRCLFMAAEM